MKAPQLIITFLLLVCSLFSMPVSAQTRLTVVELNTENLFDTIHDEHKNDYEFLPESSHRWTSYRYWEKLNKIGQEIIACGRDSDSWALPDLVALCEVENDSVLRDLTRRSVLKKAKYEYVMTNSPDLRGIDVALVYSPFSFGFISSHSIRIQPLEGMRPTRDILYVSGRILSGDTIHVFVVHAPSRMGGEHVTRKYRVHVAERLSEAMDSIKQKSPNAFIIAMGDFNDYATSPAVEFLCSRGMTNVSSKAAGSNGAKGTYRYRGQWGSLDQILVSNSLEGNVASCRIGDEAFLLEEDSRYGGVKPRRFFVGPRYNGGFSDHLPLIVHLTFSH